MRDTPTTRSSHVQRLARLSLALAALLGLACDTGAPGQPFGGLHLVDHPDRPVPAVHL